jgi:6-phosphofructokinase
MGNLVYGQSGGPTSVINATAFGVLSRALECGDFSEVYALHYGIDGLINKEWEYIETLDSIKNLLNTPGHGFGATRTKLPSNFDDSIYSVILETLEELNASVLLYNGGNDSMDTVVKLNTFFQMKNKNITVIGLPKTIDNDLTFMDHSPGYASTALFLIQSIKHIVLDAKSYKNGKVVIVEVMGRDTGWLAASTLAAKNSGLGPDIIYVPEYPFDENDFVERVQRIYVNKGYCVVVASEGIKDADGNLIMNLSREIDEFGHVQLGGVEQYLKNLINDKLMLPTRAIELSTTQRTQNFIRSKVDIEEAVQIGRYGVEAARAGQTGKMVTLNRLNNNPYSVEYALIDATLIANKVKPIPLEFFYKPHRIKDTFLEYLKPLLEIDNEHNSLTKTLTYFKKR